MSEITYLCPFCGGTVSVGRNAGGKVLPCPFCDGKSIVPALVAAAPDVSFVIVPPSPSRHRAPNKHRRNSALAYIVAFSVGLAFIAGVVVYRAKLVHPSSFADGDIAKDYFPIQEMRYEILAVNSVAQFFLEDAKKLAEFNGGAIQESKEESLEMMHLRLTTETDATRARSRAADICFAEIKLLEDRELDYCGSFMERHGIREEDYRPAFHKQFPNRIRLGRQIQKETKTFALYVFQTGLGDELTREKIRLHEAHIQDSWTYDDWETLVHRYSQFRQNRIDREIPKIIRQMRVMMQDNPDVKKMASDVGASMPPITTAK